MKLYGVRIWVRDLEAAKQFYGEILGPPEKQPWGGTLAYFKDPGGNTLTPLG